MEPIDRDERSLTTGDLGVLLEAARQAAEDLGYSMSFAILNSAGTLVGFLMMSTAILASGDVARAKARAAVMLDMESGALSTDATGVRDLLSAFADPIAFIPGGIPIHHRDTDGLLGSIGVAGGTTGDGSDDRAVARRAISAIERFR